MALAGMALAVALKAKNTGYRSFSFGASLIAGLTGFQVFALSHAGLPGVRPTWTPPAAGATCCSPQW